MRKNTDQQVYLKDYRVPDFLIKTVDLCFEIENSYTLVTSNLVVEKNPQSQSTSNSLLLDGEDLQMISVAINDRHLGEDQYKITDCSLELFNVSEHFKLTIITKIVPSENTALSGLYQSNQMYCTQCEAQGFRRITYFLDRPDVMAVFTTKIYARNLPVLLSNGNLVEERVLDDGRKMAKWHDPFKKPSYLFALVAGSLVCVEDFFRTMSGRKITLQMYVEENNRDQCQFALDSLKKAMQWDEQVYSREYDLDRYMIVAVSDFNMGAMENKGLNIFNTRYVLADPSTATDLDYHLIESVIGHEYFHNWTGNRITCRDWFQLSLKEGLTVFREQEFSAAMGSPDVKRIMDVQRLKRLQFPEDASPLAHSVQPQSYLQIDNFYSMTVYEKGAEIIRMLKVMLGHERFLKAMDYYFTHYDGMAITIEDFLFAMEKGGAFDLGKFKQWYYQAGTPEIKITSHYNKEQQVFHLSVEQLSSPLEFPMDFALFSHDGKPLLIETTSSDLKSCLVVRNAKEDYTFKNVSENPVVSLFRNFSAPVLFDYECTDDDLITLIYHDDNGFNRWQAMQNYIKNIFIDCMQKHQKGEAVKIPNEMVVIFRDMLRSSKQDKLLLGQLLSLPSEIEMGEYTVQDDVDAVHYCRNFLMDELARELQDDFQHCYLKEAISGDYQFNHQDWGKRSLRNLCLAYLARLKTNDGLDQVMSHYELATNMSDRIASLVAINDIDCAERTFLLDKFYDTWKTNSLVLDKWFSFQGNSTIPDAIARIKSLSEHPDFVLTNPNRVRSLLNAFIGNRIHFHELSGNGYRLLSYFVLKLDKMNPQVAAGLVEPFSHWKKYNMTRQNNMRLELEKIVGSASISSNVFEIVNKSLSIS